MLSAEKLVEYYDRKCYIPSSNCTTFKGPETRPDLLDEYRIVGNENEYISWIKCRYLDSLEVFVNLRGEVPYVCWGGLDKQSGQCDVITRAYDNTT